VQHCKKKQELCSLSIDSAVKLVENTHNNWEIEGGWGELREGKIDTFGTVFVVCYIQPLFNLNFILHLYLLC
jgi:hypothetical protein